MAIIGLEGNNYCVHCPIPVRLTDIPDDILRLQIIIGGVTQLVSPPLLCKDINGDFLIDLSPWVRQSMPSIQDNLTYTATSQTIANPNIVQMIIRFFNANIQHYNLVRSFVHCSDESGVLTDYDTDVKTWSCYPFSYLNGDNIVYQVLDNTAPTIPGKSVTHDTECCKGTYVKWLNDHGYYSYWLFKRSVSNEIEADDIFNMPEDIFASPRIRGAVTAGFTPTDTLTVKELMDYRYYDMIASMVYSPDVYVLDEDYVTGSNAAPSDWRRVIQDGASIEHDKRNNTFEFEMDLVLPEPYSIKRI